MKKRTGAATWLCLLGVAMALRQPLHGAPSDSLRSTSVIRHVLLISIDGMHALDFANCSQGLPSINGGTPYCPNMAALSGTGAIYVNASTTKPSDSFPGILAQVTAGTSRSTGVYYDVSYDRRLAPPNDCPGTVGTTVAYDESADFDLTKLDGGGGINPANLPRDPRNNCAPVYPHSFLRTNTIFEVIKRSNGYTAFSDKHPAYDIYNGPSGRGVDDLYNPEINSKVVALSQVPGCDPVRDPSGVDSWTSSFQNIQCYDSLKVQAILNEIAGKTHDGRATAPVPNIFGMNFQAVSVGQKLVENGIEGGYSDNYGTPSAGLLSEIEFVDNSIGQFVNALRNRDFLEGTLIVISAKHGQSPIDRTRLLRIPRDNRADKGPGDILGDLAAQATEDDVSLIWLKDQTQTANAVKTLQDNADQAAIGEIFAGRPLGLMFNDPLLDPRTPDIIVTPHIGVIYTGSSKKISEHGGFAHDDTNVMLLVSNPGIPATTVTTSVQTTQIAPTILQALGLNPLGLQAVRLEKTQVLPGLPPLNRLFAY